MPTYHVNPALSTVPPWAVQQRIGTTAARYALNTMLMPRTDSGLTYTDYRSGVMASGDGNTTHLAMQVTHLGGMDISVAQGNCVINTQNQGAYMCCLDSTKTITIPASSSTTNRYDLVVACVYDDNNSAIAGDPGVRQFTVELVQGDPSTGTPIVPEAPVGAIPLASVYVAKSVMDLAGTDPNATAPAPHNAAIQDMRGPGIVARGGMRALYGADTQKDAPAYQQAGAYPGDQRWVHTSGFQHQVYYGSDKGWRGVHNALVYNANPPAGELSWNKRPYVQRYMCHVDIPDPGTPYMIYPMARSIVTLSYYCRMDLSINLDDVDGAAVNWNTIHSFGVVVDQDQRMTVNVPPVMWGELTGPKRVNMVGTLLWQPTGNHGWAFRGNDPGANLLSVIVYPSTVQPPEW